MTRSAAAAFAAFLKDELLENVGHCLWTFTIPKMLRPYFVYRRELLGDLVRLAYETIKELMVEAVGDDKARPGVIAVPQTFGSVLNAQAHAKYHKSRRQDLLSISSTSRTRTRGDHVTETR